MSRKFELAGDMDDAFDRAFYDALQEAKGRKVVTHDAPYRALIEIAAKAIKAAAARFE